MLVPLLRFIGLVGVLLLAGLPASGNMIINLVPGSGLAANSAALAAFNRAALAWDAIFVDPIAVNIAADIRELTSPGVIGQATSELVTRPYDTVRNAIVADSAGEATSTIAAALPTAGQFTADLPLGLTLGGDISLTRANAKALGIIGPDSATDASLTFNSTFAFDYDRSDGVASGHIDFESAVTHEIGHALGFLSAIDTLEGQTAGSAGILPLDLFRFNSSTLPADLGQFTGMRRELRPGQASALADTYFVYSLSTGVIYGDGYQASHWKADEFSGTYIGVMDPTLRYGAIEYISGADARALDLIGYNVAVPEPGSMILGGLGLGLLLCRRL